MWATKAVIQWFNAHSLSYHHAVVILNYPQLKSVNKFGYFNSIKVNTVNTINFNIKKINLRKVFNIQMINNRFK